MANDAQRQGTTHNDDGGQTTADNTQQRWTTHDDDTMHDSGEARYDGLDEGSRSE
jgi:hypothetical protein